MAALFVKLAVALLPGAIAGAAKNLRSSCWEEDHTGHCMGVEECSKCTSPPCAWSNIRSIDACQAKCEEYDACEWFAYRYSDGSCWLKEEKGEYVGGAAVQVGPKSCKALLNNLTLTELAADMAGCTTADETKMAALGGGNGAGSFPRKLADCGKRNYNIFTGFNTGGYNSCMSKATGISSTCASCFATSAKYGADNCKWSCLWGSWCGSGCLSCVEPKNEAVHQCAGVEVPETSTC